MKNDFEPMNSAPKSRCTNGVVIDKACVTLMATTTGSRISGKFTSVKRFVIRFKGLFVDSPETNLSILFRSRPSAKRPAQQKADPCPDAHESHKLDKVENKEKNEIIDDKNRREQNAIELR